MLQFSSSFHLQWLQPFTLILDKNFRKTAPQHVATGGWAELRRWSGPLRPLAKIGGLNGHFLNPCF
jgi:hypothetical protein